MNVSWGWKLEGVGGWIRWFLCQFVFKKGLRISVAVKNEPQGDSMKMWKNRWYRSAGKSPWKGRRKQNPDHRRAKGRGEPCAEGGHFFHCDSKGWRAGQRTKQVTLCTSGSESEELLSQLCTWVSSVIWVWEATARKERKLQKKCRRIARPFENSV